MQDLRNWNGFSGDSEFKKIIRQAFSLVGNLSDNEYIFLRWFYSLICFWYQLFQVLFSSRNAIKARTAISIAEECGVDFVSKRP